MAFAAVHIPDFILQATLRARPELRGRPIAILDGKPPQQVVVAADRAAVQAGVQPGMAKSQAEEFAPVLLVPRSPSQETSAHAALLDLGWSFSPRMEDTAVDTVILDLEGLASLFGSEENVAHRLARGASGLELTAQIAVASNIETTFYASRGCAGTTVIAPGEEAIHIGRLPVSILSPSPEMLEIFESWGVRTCGQLAALPLPQLSERLGQQGVRLREWARGAGKRSLVLAEPRIAFAEEMELDDAVAELDPLSFILGRLLDQLCARLASRCLSTLALYLRFELESAGRERPVFQKTLSLPVPTRNAKLLLKLLRLQLQAQSPKAAVVKVVISAEAARPRATQDGLFVPAYPEPEKLELTIARLANLVGEGNVGAPELVDTHRPAAFRMSRFALQPDDLPDLPGNDEKENVYEAPKTVLRMFRPPLPMKVEGSDGHPRRVSFHNRYGEVATASGPWRTSGEWWGGPDLEAGSAHAAVGNWQWDEWDVEVHFHASPAEGQGIARGLYRIYFDRLCRSWFVRGVYD